MLMEFIRSGEPPPPWHNDFIEQQRLNGGPKTLT